MKSVIDPLRRMSFTPQLAAYGGDGGPCEGGDDASVRRVTPDGMGRGCTDKSLLFYSLIESANLTGVDRKTDFLKAVHAAIADPNALTLSADSLA